MSIYKYQLIIFDCDGVLVDSEPISCGTIAQLATEEGYPMTTEEGVHHFAGTSMKFVREFFQSRLTGPIPEDFETRYRQIIYERFQTELRPIEGIANTLNQLDLPKCVGSNGPREKILMNLRLTELTHHFGDHIFSAYDIQKWKPAPDLYLHAADKMGVSPTECLVIEDSIAGISAARAAGMDVLGYTPNEQAAAKLGTTGAALISDMREIVARIKD